MAYIKSDLIRVFPTTRREESRRFTESNLIGIIKHIVDNPCYVMPNDDLTANPIHFTINGYWFEELQAGKLITLATNQGWQDLWGAVSLTSSKPFEELEGQDTNPTDLPNSEYQGLKLNNAKDTGIPDTQQVHILHYNTSVTPNVWEIPEDSKRRFRKEAIGDDNIVDGGTAV